jgi:hypothetical protein
VNWTRWFIRGAGRLVPSELRRDWTHEWNAEVEHVRRSLGRRGASGAGLQLQLWKFAVGSLRDAAWCCVYSFERERVARRWRTCGESPGLCLALLSLLIGVIALGSGFLSATRDVLMPLPYKDAGRIATLAQSNLVASTRSPVAAHRVPLWRSESRLLEDIAEYTWRRESGELTARVSENFFPLLGARTFDGKPLTMAALRGCSECVLLSYNYWRSHYDGVPFGRNPAGGSKIIGVLEPRFWFLSREVGVWAISTSLDRGPKRKTGAVVKLRRNVSPAGAQAELAAIAQTSGVPGLDSLVEILPLQPRVRAVFGSFALAMSLAMVIIATTLHVRLPEWTFLAACFFAAKTTMALGAVLLAGIEYTRAASITMLGGTDLYTEPVSTWLFLLGSLGVLTWSIHDQRRRCRICLRRLGLAAHVGCSGSVLLDWAGTELVCIEGHGMLHVPEMASSWREPERWTALDDSWMGLFARRS